MILNLLSNHRQHQNSDYPLTITRQQILSLLHYAAPPNLIDWKTEVLRALDELQAQGEILLGTGKRYCIAPPTVLASSQENTSSLQFQGDRAYLPLIHATLKTNQPIEEVILHPAGHNFQRIQAELKSIGVRLLTILDSLQSLPQPRNPMLLRSPLVDNPFVMYSTIEVYVPQLRKSQSERWKSVFSHSSHLVSESLLRLPTDEYLWMCNGKFYELEPETAILTMFFQDTKEGYPLSIPWDETPGRILLQGVVLPSTYAKWLWRLSDPDPARYRTRLVHPSYRTQVKEAFTRLGCQLV
jgi:hypothetical protein